MTQTLHDFLTGAKNKEFATKTGIQKHADLQHVVIDSSGNYGDNELIKIIQNHPNLKPFFVKDAKTEVPIAGLINGHFISRRIDRFLINKTTKTIDFIDYKTDIDKTLFIEKYKHQLNEYHELLKSAYPDYKINGYILWTNDWVLQQI
ncbi:MAG: hypothetical protein ACLRFF_00930 [Alphaproteobacteria bacterium]